MLTPPPGIIFPQKRTKAELREIFNDPSTREDLIRRTNQRVDVSEGLAAPEYNQEPGTTSHVYDWMEHAEPFGMKLLATVHCFKKPDGTLGASGDYDPIVVVVAGVAYHDP
jgi:hypothetical protein